MKCCKLKTTVQIALILKRPPSVEDGALDPESALDDALAPLALCCDFEQDSLDTCVKGGRGVCLPHGALLRMKRCVWWGQGAAHGRTPGLDAFLEQPCFPRGG